MAVLEQQDNFFSPIYNAEGDLGWPNGEFKQPDDRQ